MQAPAQALAGACTPPQVRSLNTYCEIGRSRGLELTPLRMEVLTKLWEANQPMGAYGIAKELTRDGSDKAHANSVYRSLSRLAEAGLVVPIASWKRHLISPDPDQASWLVALCTNCSSLSCIPAVELGERINAICRDHSFANQTSYLECLGTCRACT